MHPHWIVSRILSVLYASWMLLTLATGCAPDPNRTHRGDLLDDKVTSERVRAELRRAGQEFKNVHVETADGEVTLSGSVRSQEQRLRAKQIAKNVERVAVVNDRLEIRE